MHARRIPMTSVVRPLLLSLLSLSACKKSADPKPGDTKVTEATPGTTPEAKPAAPDSATNRLLEAKRRAQKKR